MVIINHTQQYQQRFQRWIDISRKFPSSPFLTPWIQSTGRLDVQLLEEYQVIKPSIASGKFTIETSWQLTHHFYISSLWVMASYELIRTIHEKAKETRIEMSKGDLEMVKQTKVEFSRLRMPLAKLEPAESFSGTDGDIAYPIINTPEGVGWQVSTTKIIVRKSLSDLLLNTLTKVKG